MTSPLHVLRETLRLADYHANVNPDEGRESWEAIAQVEALVEVVEEFVAPWDPQHYPQLRRALAPFKDGD